MGDFCDFFFVMKSRDRYFRGDGDDCSACNVAGSSEPLSGSGEHMGEEVRETVLKTGGEDDGEAS